ncbi:MAG TPA: MFS transporter [Sphingomonas sp.]|uniref:MFS transporter n=1 Tax=Sphingomonas sp. TaxID=28214 RepID=UPI002C30BE14|nr:MFS transporter [Sphingomonas sp.]HMI19623.1 MFS transporter [Sphingomonas sp.]
MDIASRGQIAPPRQAIGFGVIGLLALGMFINYVDRGNLATAAPLIKDQLGLTNTQTGILLSAFFWTYTPFQLVAGWLAERINPYRTLAIGVGLWSLATIATGFAEGFTALLVLRLVLGMGESATFPCNAKLLARELPAERLGSANGTIGIGQALGPAVGTFAGGMLMAHFGWRPVFVLFGLVSALWLLPWLVATREASARAVTDASAPPPAFLNILGRRECWGASLGHFAHNYSLYFVISWLPLYLVKARGFTLSEMGELGAVLYVIYAISVQSSGLIADRWMAAGASSTRVRKSFTVAAHIGIAACMLVCAVAGPTIAVAALLGSGLFFGMNSATIFPIGQTLGGPCAAGKWMGVQNCIGNTAGIVAPIVTGYVVDKTGEFSLAFAIAAGVSLAGIVAWGLIIRRVEPIDWA